MRDRREMQVGATSEYKYKNRKRIERRLQPPRRHQKTREPLAPDAVIDSATRASRLSGGATAESKSPVDHRDVALCRYEVFVLLTVLSDV